MTAPTGSAIDHPETRAALTEYRRAGLLILVAGLATWAVVAIIDTVVQDSLGGFLLLVGGLAAFTWAAIVLGRSIWMGALLRRNPWEERRSVFDVVTNGNTVWPLLWVEGHSASPTTVYTVSTTRLRSFEFDSVDGAAVWLAAGRHRWAVAARPGGAPLMVVRQPRLSVTKRKFADWFDVDDSATAVAARVERRQVERHRQRRHVRGAVIGMAGGLAVCTVLGDVLHVI